MKRIVVPIDFSEATARVVDLARQLAKVFNAEIHLVHVRELGAAVPTVVGYGLTGIPELAPVSSVPGPALETTPLAAQADESQKAKLAEWQVEIAQAGITVELHEPTGDVAEEILRQAEALNADLIVMGAHGHGAMYKLLVGSVTEGVLKRSKYPVLLVPSTRP
jgi:nucleotide-binding universal stress UspA family protein